MNDRAPSPTPPARRRPAAGPRKATGSGRFVEWCEVPIFQIDREERLEELASKGRGPRRLVASARLAVASRRASQRGRRTGDTDRAGVARAQPSDPPPAAAEATAPRGGRSVTPGRLSRASRAHQARALDAPVDAVQLVADDAAWNRWAASEAELGPVDGLARLDEERRAPRRRARPESGAKPWRQRVARTLDRLAEQEVARGARLEEAVVPRRRH